MRVETAMGREWEGEELEHTRYYDKNKIRLTGPEHF
jgi:urease accessory protein UreH